MRVRVRVHPGAKSARMKGEDDHLKVWVRAPARDGAATREAIEVVAAGLDVAPSRVTCVQGEHSRTKLFDIDDARASARLARLLDND